MAKILIVDDDPLVRTAYHDLLTDFDFDVEVCENGNEAVEYCRVAVPDLIVMDIHMPIMNGLTACEKIREMPSGQKIPVIVISGNPSQYGLNHCHRCGATVFMKKPLDADNLIGTINRLLSPAS